MLAEFAGRILKKPELLQLQGDFIDFRCNPVIIEEDYSALIAEVGE
ncbi:hypothetical protein LRR81_04650 [Metabacillus sp. GX 13764]|nr:hypothetical protein [Metabacillus kandeliae]MCD7033511.1 hypothetical protein [Metabacillus kandeliae]